MKLTFANLTISLLAAGLLSAAEAPRKLPRVTEADYTKLVAAHHGKVVLVNFWASWCEPCVAEYPHLLKLARAWEDKGLVVVGISCDDDESEPAALALLRKWRPTFANHLRQCARDEAFIAAVDRNWTGSIPCTVLYGRDGRQLRLVEGEQTYERFEALVKEALSR